MPDARSDSSSSGVEALAGELMAEKTKSGGAVSAIVGLGNPGRQYESTRHNVGFMVVDLLVRKKGILLQERKFRAAWGWGEVEGNKVLLLKPLTFMNLSGEAVGEVLRYFNIPVDALLVVHDDLDLPLGRAKLVRGGGAGGHRGILSIIEHLGSQGFARLKLGIGRPVHGEPVESFVLMPPYTEDETVFNDMIVNGAKAVGMVVASGLEAAANRFNRREP